MIVSSTYTEGLPQADGRRYVQERHVDGAGKSYEIEWLGAQDAALVLAARAQELSSQLNAQADALALVAGTLLPLTKLQFRALFTQGERELVDALNAGFESHPLLTDAQKASLRTGLEDYRMALDIARPFDARVQAMLGMYVALGLLTQDRMAAILGAGNG